MKCCGLRSHVLMCGSSHWCGCLLSPPSRLGVSVCWLVKQARPLIGWFKQAAEAQIGWLNDSSLLTSPRPGLTMQTSTGWILHFDWASTHRDTHRRLHPYFENLLIALQLPLTKPPHSFQRESVKSALALYYYLLPDTTSSFVIQSVLLLDC